MHEPIIQYTEGNTFGNDHDRGLSLRYMNIYTVDLTSKTGIDTMSTEKDGF